MFQRMIDDFKESAGTSMRLTSLAAAMAFALVRDHGVPVRGGLCLCAADLWVDPGLSGGSRDILRGDADIGGLLHDAQEASPNAVAETTKSAMQSALADPMLVATGIQIVRAIGIKRLVPILAVGGLALGILASRGNSTNEEAPEA